ncbi:glyoxalase [Ruegeria arenilitoris]|uniref:glyoxalase n=1 Tax=Ruegeria arenilitoris TaxID=1173585 RepID=UPI00147B7770|nr:glyoxalase [Ruegeria arenilitoris]
MMAFLARFATTVRQFCAADLKHGSIVDGAPGILDYDAPDFNATYLRDPYGNKLSCFCYCYDPAKDSDN